MDRQLPPSYEITHVNQFDWKSVKVQRIWQRLAEDDEDDDYDFTDWNEETSMYELLIGFGDDIAEKARKLDKLNLEKVLLYSIVYLCGDVCFGSGADVQTSADVKSAREFMKKLGSQKFTTIVDANNRSKVLMVTGSQRDQNIKQVIEDIVNCASSKSVSDNEYVITTDFPLYSWIKYTDLQQYYINDE